MHVTNFLQSPPGDAGQWRDILRRNPPGELAHLYQQRHGGQGDRLRVHVLQPIAFDGIGPSQTCINICEAAAELGAGVHAYGARRRIGKPLNFMLHTPYRNIGSVLPWRRAAPLLQSRIEKQILADVPSGSLVYAWPSLGIDTFRELKRRGCSIALEMINILTIAEKRIIEQEMDSEGFHYAHYVSDQKIRNQIQMLAMADIVFTSNPNSADSLLEFGVEPSRIIATRYGASNRVERTDYKTGRPVFAFVGRLTMEKGVHHLLRAWRSAGIDGELHLYGHLDPKFARHYEELLNQPSIRLCGFHRNISRAYRQADCFIFLSLAEGGPLVTIEAAAHGLPMIVSPMAAGRIARDGQSAIVVAPHDTASVATAIRRLASSVELRSRLGRSAFRAAADHTWARAAAERLTAIQALH